MPLRPHERQTPARSTRPAGATGRVSPRGFSFVELLFAVAVMGIGFIMIAAIFPVGLQQTKLTLDETTGAANARGAGASMGTLVQQPILVSGALPYTTANSTTILPVTATALATAADGRTPVGQTRLVPNQLRSFRDRRLFIDANGNTKINDDTIWRRVSPQIISPADDRNASVVLFKRDWLTTNPPVGSTATFSCTPASTAQIVVINAQAVAQSAFNGNDVQQTPALTLYNLQPRPVAVTITRDATEGVYFATFEPVTSAMGFAGAPTPADNAAPYAVAEGTFVVISDDRIATPQLDAGRLNGRIFRVGVQRTDRTDLGLKGTNVWQLAPGYDFTTDAGDDGVLGTSDDITAVGASAGGVTVTGGAAVAYVLGRGFSDPTVTPTASAKTSTGLGAYTSTSRYSGPTQDVAAYTTFVPVPSLP